MSLSAVGDAFLSPVILDQGGVKYFDALSRDAILVALAVMRATGAKADDAKSLSFVAQAALPQAGDVSARDTAVGLVAQGYTVLAQQKFQPFMSAGIKATKDVSELAVLTKPEGASYAILLAPGMGTSMTPTPTTGTAPGAATPVTDPIVQAQESAARMKRMLLVAGGVVGAVLLVQHFRKKRVT